MLPSIRGNNLESLINGSKVIPTKFIMVINDDETFTATENPKYLQWLRQDQILIRWFLPYMSESFLGTVVQYTTSFEVWNALETLFVSQLKARIQQLKMQLQTTKKNSMPMSDYVTKL